MVTCGWYGYLWLAWLLVVGMVTCGWYGYLWLVRWGFHMLGSSERHYRLQLNPGHTVVCHTGFAGGCTREAQLCVWCVCVSLCVWCVCVCVCVCGVWCVCVCVCGVWCVCVCMCVSRVCMCVCVCVCHIGLRVCVCVCVRVYVCECVVRHYDPLTQHASPVESVGPASE